VYALNVLGILLLLAIIIISALSAYVISLKKRRSRGK